MAAVVTRAGGGSTVDPSAYRPLTPAGSVNGTDMVLKPGGPELVDIRCLLPEDSPRVAGVSSAHVHLLAEMDGDVPPIVVHRPTMRVIDGMHRIRAAEVSGRTHIAVRYFDGPEADLFIWSVQLNSVRGLPLSLSDRLVAASRIVSSHPHFSDRTIASVAGLSAARVAQLRRSSGDAAIQRDIRLGRDGRTRPLSAAAGRIVAAQFLAEHPEASIRAIARMAGISIGTAHDVRQRHNAGLDPVPDRERDRRHSLDLRPAESRRTAAQELSKDERNHLRLLREDPSVTGTAVGRTLIRLLSMHTISDARWAQLLGSIPAHCRGTVAAAARQCAEAWLAVASEVEGRSNASCLDTESW